MMYSKKEIFILSAVMICFAGIVYAQRTRSTDLRFSGRILDSEGMGVEKALIYALPNLENSDRTYTAKVQVREPVKSFSGGRYRLSFSPDIFSLIISEEYDMYVRNIEQNLVAIKKFTKEDRSIEVTLQPGITVSGTVVGYNGIPLGNIPVSFVVGHSTDACIYNFEQNDTVITDDTGNYEIEALWPERQYIFSAQADGYLSQNISRYLTDDTPDHRITIEPIILKKMDISISGVVVNEIGRPVTDALVVFTSQGQSSRQIQTDSQGRFSIQNLSEGDITIQVFIENFRDSLAEMNVNNGISDLRIEIIQPDVDDSSIQSSESSLIGMTLPDLSDFGIEISDFDSLGRMMLVCFININEASSQSLLSQLNSTNQELRSRDVIVAAVQSSTMSQTALDRWVEQNNIEVPVGLISGTAQQVEQMQFKMGVKSLPWLVLTDRENVIVSEGFSLYELDAKINLATGQ